MYSFFSTIVLSLHAEIQLIMLHFILAFTVFRDFPNSKGNKTIKYRYQQTFKQVISTIRDLAPRKAELVTREKR